MINANQIINLYLENKRVPKHEFDDLKLIIEETKGIGGGKRKRILDWFRLLQETEIIGWRPRQVTRKITQILKDNSESNKILFYALFCPSYKKGKEIFGFRTDDVGMTTKAGVKNLVGVWEETQELGFSCERPLAIFFDLAIEQVEKVLSSGGLADLEVNIKNLKSHLSEQVKLVKLSEINKDLFSTVGYRGTIIDPLPIPDETFKRIVERGEKFYELFGWTQDQVVERSKVIASSEALTGEYLKREFPMGIMVYTPTMLERGAVYSGMSFKTDPLPIIFPKKEGS